MIRGISSLKSFCILHTIGVKSDYDLSLSEYLRDENRAPISCKASGGGGDVLVKYAAASRLNCLVSIMGLRSRKKMLWKRSKVTMVHEQTRRLRRLNKVDC